LDSGLENMMSPRPIKVADEVWIATALLHREHADRESFTISEVVERAEHEKLTPRLRPGVRVHATAHCVADLPPSPGRYCMLRSMPGNRRRLYRPGDPIHADRQGAKTVPVRDEIPEPYRPLLDWYQTDYVGSRAAARRDAAPDPLIALRGSGAELWRDEAPDEYVDRLRSEWS
jgi:hypothetical protein